MARLPSVPGWDRVVRLLQQQDDTILLTYSSADPVGAATVQGIFNAFVDQANIAVSGLPPTYTLQTNQVEDESLQPIQYIAPGMIGYGIAVGAGATQPATTQPGDDRIAPPATPVASEPGDDNGVLSAPALPAVREPGEDLPGHGGLDDGPNHG